MSVSEDVCVVGVAKSIEREAGREHFYRRGQAPFRLDAKSPVLYYLQRLRDEAHRFAIGSHRKKRSKAIGASPLEEIAGVGAAGKRRCSPISARPGGWRRRALPILRRWTGSVPPWLTGFTRSFTRINSELSGNA